MAIASSIGSGLVVNHIELFFAFEKLGKRILRCETAPLCALSAVMYATGNLE